MLRDDSMYICKVVTITTDFTDADGDTLTHSLVQYTFEDEEHPVLLRPHGNSKHKESFLQTMPSTLQKLKKVAQDLTPKFAICEVSSSSGGLASASSVGSLPQNQQQVSNIRQRTSESHEPSIGKKQDPLFAVTMCKESEGCSTQHYFVRSS